MKEKLQNIIQTYEESTSQLNRDLDHKMSFGKEL